MMAACCETFRENFQLHPTDDLCVTFDAGLNRWMFIVGASAVTIDFCPWCGVSLRPPKEQ